MLLHLVRISYQENLWGRELAHVDMTVELSFALKQTKTQDLK